MICPILLLDQSDALLLSTRLDLSASLGTQAVDERIQRGPGDVVGWRDGLTLGFFQDRSVMV
ncbi:MAG TPA: hypothetical protein VF458_02105 [Ktedonobacteraceae bacterium]